ncbi:hypothetical protein [Mycobacteroides abscessus]|uniref:hypothetical protein n=1 Tax=Mycobacteroides abscessus TaxID=36809 RepID=UPI001927FFCE|nr:hypothetical protein [Mycobacteroides abscessus]MBL3753030.1 hypothetical protein [Mycobacteroides abscessus subsp. massiliense]
MTDDEPIEVIAAKAEAEDAAAALAAEELVTVEILAPYRTAFSGVAYDPGSTAIVPQSLADHWVRMQWAQPKPSKGRK